MPDSFKKTIVASGDYKSADPATATLNTRDATSLRVGVNATALSGSGCTVTVTISGVDKDGTSYTLLQKAITGTGITEMLVDPRVPASAGLIAQLPLPEKVTVSFVGSGTRTTLTYDASAEVA